MPDTPARVVIAAPNWLGDAVMALPAVRSVRAHWPAARLVVAARPSVAALFAMVPEVDEVLTLSARSGATHLQTWRVDAARLAEARGEIALLLPNAFSSAFVASRAGIPERWGYATLARRHLLTRAVRRPRGLPHQADYYLALVTALGLPTSPRIAPIAVPAEARARAAALVPAGRDGYVVMAPGAAYGGAKQWPPERFAEVAATLWRTRRIPTAIVGAGGDAVAAQELCDALMRIAGGRSANDALVDLVGRTDLAALAAVLAGARAVVANDSGAMHLAAAVGAPVIAIFGATNEHHTAPLSAAADAPAARIATADVWCRPCMLRECPLGHACMRGVTAAQVTALIP